MRIRSSLVVVATILTSLSLPAQAELILSGIPAIQERTELDKDFVKLAAQLTDALGEPVRYVAPIAQISYAQEVRKGTYDILIDNPVLAAWRIAKGTHKPVAIVDTTSSFLVVVPATDNSTKSPEQLIIGKAICVQAAPSVANMMLMSLYPNPLQIPATYDEDSQQSIAEKVINGTCRAGVVNAAFFEGVLNKDTQNKLRVIYKTKPLAANAMTVSNKVSEEKRKALSQRVIGTASLNDPLVQSMNAVNSAIGKNAAKATWLEAKPESFKGLEQLLIQQSFGWE